MQDSPTSTDLLDIARQTLLDSVLPALPEERRLDGLMIANAMAIAARGIGFGEGLLRAECARLQELLGESAAEEATDGELEARVRELNRRLAERVRGGAYDEPGAQGDAVRQYLWESTVQKLRESNPKHLDAEGLE
ncbi:MAG: DUF6285 domain-containing protein [Alphaproteobacteria bacterium]|nr:DUF6285 domain-containing protein [Alphaproteobacteria bacterium]